MSSLGRKPDKDAANTRLAHLQWTGKLNLSAKERCKTPADLPIWVKKAAGMHDTLGMTWKKVCEQMKRNPNTLKEYISTEGMKQYRAAIRQVIDDPVAIARQVARHSAPGLLFELYEHLETAKLAGDMAEAGRTLRHLTDLADMAPPKNGPSNGPQIIQINLGSVGGTTISAEIPMGESSAEKVVDAEIIEG
jgi:hypothetical protein